MSPYLESLLINNFGSESNIMFHVLQQEKNVFPRKVQRTIIGPYYTKHLKPSSTYKRIDPLYQMMMDFVKDSEHKILAVITDESTQYINFFDDEQQNTEQPRINIENLYFCSRETAKELGSLINKKNIIE